MRWFAVLAASLAVHAGALAAMPAGDGPLRPRAVTPRVELVDVDLDVVATPAPPVEAIEVSFFEVAPAEPTVAPPLDAPVAIAVAEPGRSHAAVPAAPPAAAATPAGDGALLATSATTGAEAAAAAEPGAVDPASAMSMRQGKADLSIPTEVIARVADGAYVPPDRIAAELQPQRDGSYVKNDLVFTASIEPDGTVHFTDKANFNYKFHIPNPVKIVRGAGRHLASWTEDPYGVSTGMNANKNREGTDDDGDGKLDEGDTFTIFSAGFDLTDWAMRSNGEDPYTARKAAFLDRTRDDRVEIGSKYRADQLEVADQYMLDHLRALWKDPALDVAARRVAIFELWDDCAETGEARVIEAAVRARAALDRFVRTKLPEDGAAAYTADELARLNARRRSRAVFAPYR